MQIMGRTTDLLVYSYIIPSLLPDSIPSAATPPLRSLPAFSSLVAPVPAYDHDSDSDLHIAPSKGICTGTCPIASFVFSNYISALSWPLLPL